MNDQNTASRIQFGSRDDRKLIEEGTSFAPKFDSHGLITAVAVDAANGEVLMVAYMNEESLRLTLALGEAVYYSRSRKEIWHKGKTSGHTQKVVEILADCDQDALVLRVDQQGAGACHTGYRSCFFRRVALAAPTPEDGPLAAELKTVHASKAYDAKAVYGKA